MLADFRDLESKAAMLQNLLDSTISQTSSTIADLESQLKAAADEAKKLKDYCDSDFGVLELRVVEAEAEALVAYALDGALAKTNAFDVGTRSLPLSCPTLFLFHFRRLL